MKPKKKNSRFHLFFLKEDGEWRAQIKEIDETNLSETIRKHLEQGESVLIEPKSTQKIEPQTITEYALRKDLKKSAAEPWYFIHA